ncbi:membrane hypothetical protein [Gammaproteobacteria bacterium]
MDVLNLTNVLTWLVGPGSAIVAGYMLSLLVENWKGWHKLPRWVKFLAPLVASPLLSLLAALALNYTDLLKQVAPWYQIAVSSLLTYVATQRAYMTAQKSGYNYKLKPTPPDIPE